MSETDGEAARIKPGEVRYIKLGPGGVWESASLDGGRIDWGIPENPHDLAHAQDWVAAKQFYIDRSIAPATATGFVRELHDFHTLGPSDLWITFARGHLWWAFAEPGVHLSGGDGKKEGEGYRTVIDPWRNTDVMGRPLTVDSLSTRLTQLAGYRGTICSVRKRDYLLRRINAEQEPLVACAVAARSALIEATTDLVRHLHWAASRSQASSHSLRSITVRPCPYTTRIPTETRSSCRSIISRRGRRRMNIFDPMHLRRIRSA